MPMPMPMIMSRSMTMTMPMTMTLLRTILWSWFCSGLGLYWKLWRRPKSSRSRRRTPVIMIR